MRWILVLWLAVSALGLTLVAASLVWTGWFAGSASFPTTALPQGLVPLLAIPVIVAAVAYGVAVWRVWGRKPAIDAWLIGVAGRLVYLVAEVIVSGSTVADVMTWDSFSTVVRLAVPGIFILETERHRLENPLRR